MERLSFAPDRRSLQTTYYHFNDRAFGDFDRKGLSQIDTLTIELEKIYDKKFPGMSSDQIKNLTNILVTNVPISHHNLTFLAAANYIVQYMRYSDNTDVLTPELFNKYYNTMERFLVSEPVQSPETKKVPKDPQLVRANYKATLLRYILYVQAHIPYQLVVRT